jgi:hypothetical protein
MIVATVALSLIVPVAEAVSKVSLDSAIVSAVVQIQFP